MGAVISPGSAENIVIHHCRERRKLVQSVVIVVVSPYIGTSSRNSVVTLYPCKITVERGGRVSHSAERSVDTVSLCQPVLVSPLVTMSGA